MKYLIYAAILAVALLWVGRQQSVAQGGGCCCGAGSQADDREVSNGIASKGCGDAGANLGR